MRALPAFASAILLISTGSWPAEPPAVNTARARHAEALAEYYAQLYGYAEARAREPALAARFHQRAVRVLMGERVEPDIPHDAALGAASAAEARRMRAALVTALQHGAANRLPVQAARAQASFDCWMAAFPPETGTSADCKRHFYAAMAEIEATRPSGGAEGAAASPPPGPREEQPEAPGPTPGQRPPGTVAPSASPTPPAAPPLDPIAAALLGTLPNGAPTPGVEQTGPPQTAAAPLSAATGMPLDAAPIAGWIKSHSRQHCPDGSTPFDCSPLGPVEPGTRPTTTTRSRSSDPGDGRSGGGSGVSSGPASEASGAGAADGSATAGGPGAAGGTTSATGTDASGTSGTSSSGTGGPGSGASGTGASGSGTSGPGSGSAGAGGAGAAGSGASGSGATGSGAGGSGAGPGGAGTGGSGSSGPR